MTILQSGIEGLGSLAYLWDMINELDIANIDFEL